MGGGGRVTAASKAEGCGLGSLRFASRDSTPRKKGNTCARGLRADYERVWRAARTMARGEKDFH